MARTVSALVHRDNLAEGKSAEEQLDVVQGKCAQAAELLNLYRQMQPTCILLVSGVTFGDNWSHTALYVWLYLHEVLATTGMNYTK